jgi:UPF0271 protein
MAQRVDLNADLGESFGAWSMGDDAAMLQIVSSANVACGFHGGDPMIMAETVRRAKEHGVNVGAHPGYRDIWGFGRRHMPHEKPDDLVWQVAYQIGALAAIARAQGMALTHVKAHGALSNHAMVDRPTADAIGKAVDLAGEGLAWFVLPKTQLEAACEAAGLPCVREVFADRNYEADGRLVSRREPDAIIHDAEHAAERVVRMVEEGAITARDGSKLSLPIDTICVHGDTPGAVAMADRVRNSLEKSGWTIGLP